MDSLVTEKAARIVEYRKRRNRYEEQTVFENQLNKFKEDGWSVVGQRKNGFRIKRSKSIDILLENDFWSILYLLGYSELNAGRKFSIEIAARGEKTVSKQIDVFAKDAETIVIAECKAAEIRSKKSLQKDLGEFEANKGPIARALRKSYGRDLPQKILWLFVTRNIEWSSGDKARAHGYNIRPVTELELRYFSEVAKRLGPTGRYQFHATYLANGKVGSLQDVRVPAIRTKIGGRWAYLFIAPAKRLLPISFINHRDLRDPEAAPAYQRLVIRSRLQEVSKFLKSGGYFANSIIVNFKRPVRFDRAGAADTDGTSLGALTLPDEYKSMWIIDGQHRLYGYAELEEDDDSQKIPVLAFDRMPLEEEGRLFKTINSEQKRVSRALLDELQGEQELHSTDKARQLRAIAARIIEQLRSEVGGPFEDKFKDADLPGGPDRPLNLTSIANAIVASGLIGRTLKGEERFLQGAFSGETPANTIDASTAALSGYFDIIKHSNEARWDNGKQGLLCTNVAVEAYIRLLGEICLSIPGDTRNDPRELSTSELLSVVSDYLKPTLQFNKSASDDVFAQRFKVPFGSGGPARYFYRLCESVQTKNSTFKPEGLEEYKRETAAEVTDEADRKIRIIQSDVPAYIVSQLKTSYPGDKFLQRATKNQRILVAAFEKQNQVEPEEQGALETYIDFIDFKKIVETKDNWHLFQDTLNIRLPNEKHAARYIGWFDEINRLRRIAAHPFGKRYKEHDVEILDAVFDALSQNGVINGTD